MSTCQECQCPLPKRGEAGRAFRIASEGFHLAWDDAICCLQLVLLLRSENRLSQHDGAVLLAAFSADTSAMQLC